MLQVGVVGGGAVGLLVAAHLATTHKVTVYVRNSIQLKELNENRLNVTDWEQTVNVSVKLVDEIKREDILFICVKQHQLEPLLPKLTKTLSPLFFLQNGMAHIDLLKGFNFNNNTVMIGTCEHGSLKINNYTIKQTGFGKINASLFHGNVEKYKRILNTLHKESFPFIQVEDWYEMLATKLVANAVINPLTAIFQVPNGEILTNPSLSILAKQLCYEACTVLELTEEKQWSNISRIVTLTQTNYSSMMMDIKNKRKTEINGISGFVLKHANINVPYTEFAYYAIKAMELQQGARE